MTNKFSLTLSLIPKHYSRNIPCRATIDTLIMLSSDIWLYSTIVVTGGPAYCASLASTSLYSAAPPCKLDRVESLYGGTKSLYAKSPPLTRANLNRSQSVYTKSSGPIVHREGNPHIYSSQRSF